MREHVRLWLLEWALDQFLTVVKFRLPRVSSDFSLHNFIPNQLDLDIAVTDAFMIETNLEIGEQCFFIVESLHTPSTRKFTSSLAHGPQGSSKIEQTVAAFTHFVYAKWNQTLVHGDAQGRFLQLVYQYLS